TVWRPFRKANLDNYGWPHPSFTANGALAPSALGWRILRMERHLICLELDSAARRFAAVRDPSPFPRSPPSAVVARRRTGELIRAAISPHGSSRRFSLSNYGRRSGRYAEKGCRAPHAAVGPEARVSVRSSVSLGGAGIRKRSVRPFGAICPH